MFLIVFAAILGGALAIWWAVPRFGVGWALALTPIIGSSFGALASFAITHGWRAVAYLAAALVLFRLLGDSVNWEPSLVIAITGIYVVAWRVARP